MADTKDKAIGTGIGLPSGSAAGGASSGAGSAGGGSSAGAGSAGGGSSAGAGSSGGGSSAGAGGSGSGAASSGTGTGAGSNTPTAPLEGVKPLVNSNMLDEVLAKILEEEASPEAIALKRLALEQITKEKNIIPSRIPAPLNITEIGGYYNLLMDDPEMRKLLLASVLGLPISY